MQEAIELSERGPEGHCIYCCYKGNLVEFWATECMGMVHPNFIHILAAEPLLQGYDPMGLPRLRKGVEAHIGLLGE